MKRILIALALLLAPSIAFAQCSGVFPPNTVCGNNSGVAAPPKAITATGGTTASSPLLATDGGTPNLINLTLLSPPSGVTVPYDGMRIRWMSTWGATGNVTVKIASFPPGPVYRVTMPDGYSEISTRDLEPGQTAEIEFIAGRNVFALITPPSGANNFLGGFFAHGFYKIQAGNPMLYLGSNDGGAVIAYNSTSGGYRLVSLGPSGACGQNLFNGTAHVDGVANQSLADHLYYVFISPQAGATDTTSPPANSCLEFWSATSLNPGATGLTVGNPWGIVTRCTYIFHAGGNTCDTIDPTRIFVGLVRPISGSVAYVLAGAPTLYTTTYSHSWLSRWQFGFQTSQVPNVVTTTALTSVATPVVVAPSEGLTDSPRFSAHSVVTCTAGGVVASANITVSGQAFDGTTWMASSPTVSLTSTSAGGITGTLSMEFDSAPPVGFYAAQLQHSVSAGGTCTFVDDILGHISY